MKILIEARNTHIYVHTLHVQYKIYASGEHVMTSIEETFYIQIVNPH